MLSTAPRRANGLITNAGERWASQAANLSIDDDKRAWGKCEALRINLCEQVVPDGESRQRAEALALEIARFPQGCMRADRRSVYHQEGLGLREAMRYEWENGIPAVAAEGRAGAARFASGKGRSGNFSDI